MIIVSWLRLWLLALGLLTLIWLPLAVLIQIDAMIQYMTAWDIVKTVALLDVLLALLAAILALLAVSLPKARHVAVVLPPVLMIAWLLFFASRRWLEVTMGGQIVLSNSVRLALIILVVGGFVWMLLRRYETITTLLAESSYEARFASIGLLVIALPIAIAGALPHARAAIAPVQRGPDVIIISFDALSAVDAKVCDPKKSLMPNLTQLARQSTCFTRLYAASNFTVPTTTTLETGLLPWSTWSSQLGAKIVPNMRSNTISRALRDRGYKAFAVSANYLASPNSHGTYWNYDAVEAAGTSALRDTFSAPFRSFVEAYLTVLTDPTTTLLATLEKYLDGPQSPFDANVTFDRGLEIIAKTSGPRFLWMHVLPPHYPYLPPPSTKYRLLPKGHLETWLDLPKEDWRYLPENQASVDQVRLRYRESIMGADEALGRLLAKLKQSGEFNHTILVVTSDHGESFENGFLGHGGTPLYEPLIRVPLVIHLPGQRAGRVIVAPVSSADVAPTVVEVAGARPLPMGDGRSLAPMLQGHQMSPSPVFSMALPSQSRFNHISNGHFVVIVDHMKLDYRLASGKKPQLFDVDQDPLEHDDLSAKYPSKAAMMFRLLKSKLYKSEQMRAALTGR